MREKVSIVSNNPRVWEEYPLAFRVEGSYEDVLLTVRDLIHRGYRLISHPLSGSVKPGETPYKSVIVGQADGTLDFRSLSVIEKAIETARKFTVRERNWPDPERIDRDLQTIDASLLDAGTESLSPDLYVLCPLNLDD